MFPPMNGKDSQERNTLKIQNCCTYNDKFSLTIHDNMMLSIVFLTDLLELTENTTEEINQIFFHL